MINFIIYRFVDFFNGEELCVQVQKEFNLIDFEIKVLVNYKFYGNFDKGVVRGFEVNVVINFGVGFSLNGNYVYVYVCGKSVDGIWGNIDCLVCYIGIVVGNYIYVWNDYMLNVNINGCF